MVAVPLVIENCTQVTIEMTCSGRTVMNVIGVENVGNEPMATILELVKSAWEQTNGPLYRHSSTTSMVGYHGIDLTSADGAVGYLGSGATGAVSGDIATMGACAVVKLSSGTRGRSKQGRVFHGPLVESQVDGNGRTLVSGMVTDITSAYELFRAELDTAGHVWVVISRKNLSYAQIVASAAEGIIGTQRRRIR
jgi:hypothetical protein